MSYYKVIAHRVNHAPPVVAPVPAARKRKRARAENGAFIADDPATPENEAWVEV
jgi:hypothetical protein